MRDEEFSDLNQQVLTMRIILVAMSMGLLVFGFIVNTVIGPADAANDETSQALSYVGLCLGLGGLVLHRLVGSFVAGSAAKDLPVDESAARKQLLAGYQTGFIVSLALLEGPAFVCLVFYGFVVGERILIMMAGLLWMAMVIKFPFPDGVEAQIVQRLRTAEDRKALGR